MSDSLFPKVGMLLTTLVMAAIAGVYLAGILVPMLLEVAASTPWYETWWSYYRALDRHRCGRMRPGSG